MENDNRNADLVDWERWFNKYVKPVFVPEGRNEYYELLKRMQAPFYPKYWIAEKFYKTIENDNRFDEELKLFFSFLYSCGFYMENIVTFEEWINSKNWWQPNIRDSDEKTILNILDEPNGMNKLKIKLRWLPFLTRPEGY